MTTPSPDAQAIVRICEQLTTQVQRIADALQTPAAIIRDGVLTPLNTVTPTPNEDPRCVCGDPIEWWTGPGGSAGWIHSPHSDTPILDVHRPRPRSDDGPTTPATTCGAQHHRFDDGRLCIRAAHHHGDHIDEQGYHWSDTVAVYPLTDSTVRVAHWRPVSDQSAEEQQELAGMVSDFIDAQQRQARAAGGEACLTHIAGACDSTTRDCVHGNPATADEHDDPHPAAACRRMETRTCPPSYNGPCGVRPCARFESDDPTPWLDTGADEASYYRQLSAEQGQALSRAEASRADVQRDRDQHAAVLTEVLATFGPMRDTYDGPVSYYDGSADIQPEQFERWRSTVAPTVERPWWEQVALYEKEAVEATKHVLELKATIERVRTTAVAWERMPTDRHVYIHDAALAVRAALADTEPASETDQQPEPTARNFAAYQAAIARVVLVLREAREHREQTDPSERQDCVMCGADHFAEIRDAIKSKQPDDTEQLAGCACHTVDERCSGCGACPEVCGGCDSTPANEADIRKDQLS